jgi:hypothetical protein
VARIDDMQTEAQQKDATYAAELKGVRKLAALNTDVPTATIKDFDADGAAARAVTPSALRAQLADELALSAAQIDRQYASHRGEHSCEPVGSSSLRAAHAPASAAPPTAGSQYSSAHTTSCASGSCPTPRAWRHSLPHVRSVRGQ